MADTAVDTAFLAGFTAVAQPAIETLISSPTPDLVVAFLSAVAAKAHEFDQVRSDNLRLGVELENAVRRGEAQTRQLKATAENAMKEVETLRRQLNEEETNRRSLSAQLDNIQNSSSTSSLELSNLQAQVSRLERSNRDTLALLDSKSTAHDKLAQEMTQQHQKIVALRREISTLEEKTLSAENAVSSSRFRESSLQQEVSNLKRNNDYLDNELKIKTSEHTKFRKEKNTRISELQRQNEESASTIEALQRTDATLRKRLEDVGQKADDAFAKIQRLQEDASRTQESFRAELDNSKRLFELQKESAETQKRRVESLEHELEDLKDQASQAVTSLQAELKTEEQRSEGLEKKVEELEARLVQSNAVPPISNGLSTPTPGTPRPGSSQLLATPGSARARGGLTTTQLYSELQTARSQLDKQRRVNEELRGMVDEHVQKLELKEPEMQEIQDENAHLAAEVDRLSAALGKVVQEKDALRKESRKWQNQIEGLVRETELLRQQLRDHGAQIRILLYEVKTRSEGETLTPAERQQLEQMARSATDDAALEGMSDTGRFISQRLVQFRSIAELQQQNEQLLRLTRTLGEQMEGDEAKAKQNQQEKDKVELDELRVKAARYADEVKSMATQAESYARERDMFRRMLSHRGRLPAEGDLQTFFGASLNGAASPGAASQSGLESDLSRQLADHVKLLREMQAQYDAFRKETLVDQRTSKDQLDQLSRDRHELQSQVARVGSQLTLAQERYEMLQNNYNFLQQEKEASQKRQNELAESAARQDIRYLQTAEELTETKGLSDSLKNENANLKMEKELWRRVETRLNEDKQALTEERTRLNKVITDTQTLYNERELAESESRRKMQSRNDVLENELQETKRKLDEEVEAGKNARLRREYEQEQSRTRVEDLMKSLGNTKEELAAAKTARDQLQARVDELKIEVRSAEERAQALRPQPTPRPTQNAAVVPETTVGDGGLSREQELGVELADVRRELDLTKAELENAKSQVEQYKAISQSSEEQLQEINDTADQFREDMDSKINEKDAKIQDLEQRLADISSELAENNSQLSELRAAVDDHSTRMEQQRVAFENELGQVRDESERHKEAAKFHQDDLKAQAEIAQQAQQNYENELVKHADAARQVQEIRNKYNEIKLEVSRYKAESQAAQTALAQNEESWTSNKEKYENEIVEMRRRYADLDNQNKLLHQQLEGISGQISALREKRTAGDDSEAQAAPEASLHNLQEVIRYLRDEKNIVEAQYELSMQEGKRIRQQLEHSQNQLDETRLKLEQERHRQTTSDSTTMSHSKLMDTINELNVFRESSVTLRNEARAAQAQVAEKTKQVEDLIAQIQPLQTSVRELEAEREAAQGEVKLLQEDRDRWQQRTQNILQKYDRIDPAELEGLKEQIISLQRERDEALSAKDSGSTETQSLQDKVLELETAAEQAKTNWTTSREKLVEQFKGRSRDLTMKIRAAEAESITLRSQLQEAQEELSQAVQARDEALAATSAASAAATANANTDTPGETDGGDAAGEEPAGTSEEATAEAPSLQTRVQELEAQVQGQLQRVSQLEADLTGSQESTSSAQARADDLAHQLDAANKRLASLESSNPTDAGQATDETEVSTLRQQVVELQSQLDATKEELIGARGQAAPGNHDEETKEHMSNLERDLSNAKSELAALRDSKPISDGEADGTSTSGQAEGQIEQLKAELEATYKTRFEELEATFQQRTNSMRTQLSNKLKEGKAAIRMELEKEHSEALDKLRSEHQTALAQLKEAHQKELEAAKGQSNQTLSQQSNDQPPPTPSTPSGKPPSGWNLTPEEARELCQNNETMRQIVRRTIVNKLDEHTAKVKAEAESAKVKELEAQKLKLDKAKEQAVLLEGKKLSLKINMSETRCRNFAARIEVVEKAATDTPQKPVVEVWNVAKDVKAPPPASAARPAAQAAQAAQAAATPSGTSITTEKAEQGKLTTAPSSATTTAPPAPALTASADPADNTTDQATPAATSTEAQAQANGNPAAPARRPSVSQPRGGSARGGRGGIPTPASKLPQAGTAAGQQGSSQRGRGSGLPRGGSGSVRGRGGLSGAANQFVPGGGGGDGVAGNKRPREDGAGAAEGAKRARGGGRGG